MARLYSVPFQALTVSAQQDLWAFTTGGSLEAVLESLTIASSATAVAELQIAFVLFTGSYTAGSGGSSATIAKTDPGDAAASFTARTQDTTKTLVGSGTSTVLWTDSYQMVNGYLWPPPMASSAPLIFRIPISARLTVQLNSTPSSVTISGNAVIREGS